MGEGRRLRRTSFRRISRKSTVINKSRVSARNNYAPCDFGKSFEKTYGFGACAYQPFAVFDPPEPTAKLGIAEPAAAQNVPDWLCVTRFGRN